MDYDNCGSALTLKVLRNPSISVLFSPVPDSDGCAPPRLDAGTDILAVLLLLLLLLLLRRRKLHADIRLGVCGLDAEIGVQFDGGHLLLGAGGLAHAQMSLHSHAVDAAAIFLDQLDDISSTFGLVAAPFEVVVVVSYFSGGWPFPVLQVSWPCQARLSTE